MSAEFPITPEMVEAAVAALASGNGPAHTHEQCKHLAEVCRHNPSIACAIQGWLRALWTRCSCKAQCFYRRSTGCKDSSQICSLGCGSTDC